MKSEPVKYLLPRIMRGDEVAAELGRNYTCPWCLVSTTRGRRDMEIGWIETPARRRVPRLVCQGCAIDVYVTCASRGFTVHAYKSLVEQYAELERVSLRDFRRRCLEHQFALVQEMAKGSRSDTARYRDFEAHLSTLLRNNPE